MKPVRITPPMALPVSLAEMKDYVDVGFPDDDVTQSALIAGAVEHLDGYSGILGRCLVNQEWACSYEGWSDALRLPFPDVSAATVTYRDAQGGDQTVAASSYEVVDTDLGATVLLRPSFDPPALSQDVALPVRVQFTAGYGTAADVPWPLKVAVMMLAAHMYDRDKEKPPASFNVMVKPYRVVMM